MEVIKTSILIAITGWVKLYKHKWTDRCRDGWAYTPDDIKDISIETAFISFCKECEIDFKGNFNTLPPRQISLLRLNNDMR